MSFIGDEKTPEVLEEESTIFTSSPIKTEKKKEKAPKSQNQKMVISLVAALLVVLIAIGGAVLVPLLAPEESEVPAEDNISVVFVSPEKIKEVTITRKDSVSTYLSTLSQEMNTDTGEKETVVSWTIKGVDPSLTSTEAIGSMLEQAFSLYASRIVEPEEGADYGFSSPRYVIEMKGYDEADDLVVTIGNEAPASSGVYATLGKEIYLISVEAAAEFSKTDEQMATSFAISGATVDGDTLDYFYNDKLASFDKITLSGKNFPRKLTFGMNSVSNTGNYNDYIMTAPVRRYADTTAVGSLLEYAKTGLTAAEAYKYNPTAADLKKYGLNNPDMQLSIEFGGKKVEFKATKYDDEYYAVIVTGKENVIFKVAASFLAVAEYAETDFANSLMFIEVLTDFKNLTFNTAGKTYSFDIEYKAATEETEQVLNITMGGKKIETQNFQNFYQHLVVECNEKTLDKMSGAAVLTVKASRASGEATVMKFIKASDRRYYVEVDSAPIGLISATKMDNILNYLAAAAENKSVPGIG
ncbi:MAG: DUF4340 domain-containing protein [Ruminococcaceae bacterium]|nr:DUF4340 domain-containing protein [Oscillospiraceae bacterium]